MFAAAAKIDGVRVRPSPERTRIVFDLGQPVDHAIFSLTDPHRLVIDIEAAELAVDLKELRLDGTPINKIRYSRRNEGKELRIHRPHQHPVT